MTAANANRCIANTLVYEGGFTIIRSDPGNWTGGKVGVGELRGTNMGIAANTYPTLDLRSLTKDQVIAIYRRDYWPKAMGDQMPMGVDQVSYDGVVNSGPGRGVKWVGAALGLPSTASNAAIAAAANAAPDKVALVKKAVAKRMAFLRALGTWGTFGAGWAKRCTQVEAVGVKMALEARGMAPTSVAKEIKDVHAPEAQKKATASATAAGASGTTAGGTGTGTATQLDVTTFDWTAWLLIGGVVTIALCLTVFFVWQWNKNRLRVQAYNDVAAGVIGG